MGNPFKYRMYDGREVETTSADDRVRKVKEFNYDQCNAALAVPNLQKSVERAVHVRLRALGVPSITTFPTTPTKGENNEPSRTHQ